MLRVLVFSAAAICGFTPAFADRMFTAEEVMTVVELARSRQCESGCAFGGVRVERIDLPAILRSGDRQGFRVTGQSCGSGGCSSAIIAVGSVDAYYLGDGLSVSAHSASIQPVSEATRISETPLAGRPSIGPLATSIGTSTGNLCAETYETIPGDDLKRIFWGSRVDGINRQGMRWSEYLARDQVTIFVNAKGEEIVGKYRFNGDQICFGYRGNEATSCKRVARCATREGQYVIEDLDGDQTSVITAVEMHAAATYHHRRRPTLLRNTVLVGSFQRPDLLTSSSTISEGLRVCIRRGGMEPIRITSDRITFHDRECVLEPPIANVNALRYEGIAGCFSEGYFERDSISLRLDGPTLSLKFRGSTVELERCTDGPPGNGIETTPGVSTPSLEKLEVGRPNSASLVEDCARVLNDKIRLECFDAIIGNAGAPFAETGSKIDRAR